MVDISGKAVTARRATASGTVTMSKSAFAAALNNESKKGDPVAVAELAGVMAAKRTSDIIPLCHPLAIANVNVETSFDETRNEVTFEATVKTNGQTGVEMEALAAASASCLTLYDMLKAIDKAMTIKDIKLLEKAGGASGDYVREERAGA
jgi:cyclic pyranopterin phosphate synthase